MEKETSLSGHGREGGRYAAQPSQFVYVMLVLRDKKGRIARRVDGRCVGHVLGFVKRTRYVLCGIGMTSAVGPSLDGAG